MEALKKLVKTLQALKAEELAALDDEAFAAKGRELERAIAEARTDIAEPLKGLEHGKEKN